MTTISQRKLVAGTVAVAMLAAAGAAFAAMKLDHATTTNRIVAIRPSVGIGGFGLGGRLGGRGLGGGVGPGARGGFGANGRGFGLGLGLFGQGAASITSYLGIDSSTLRSDLQNGQTLAQIAKAQGKTAGGLVSAIVTAEEKALDSAVTAGRLTAAQKQQIESRLSQTVTAIVNGTRPAGGFFGGDFFGPGFANAGRSPGAATA